MRTPILIAGLLTGVLLAGCSNDSQSPLSPSRARLVAVSPADGTTNVRVDAGLTLTFNGPVDREMVQRELRLISESAIADSVCPDSATLYHPDMEHCMGDPAMMHHLDMYHATSGSFTWNATGTACTFQPTAWMIPATEYMVHMGREMTEMVGGSMDGMMRDHGPDMMSGDVTLHFMTMDTSGGHDGHH